MEGEPHGSFIQGLIYGMVGVLIVFIFTAPDLSLSEFWALTDIGDHIRCKRVGVEVAGTKRADCEIRDLERFDKVQKVFCYRAGGVLKCQVRTDKDLELPGDFK